MLEIAVLTARQESWESLLVNGFNWNDAMFSLLHICIALIGHRAYEVGGFQSGRLCSWSVFVKQTLLTQSCSKNVLPS